MAKVVIIDDEASILELMNKFISTLGHEVIACQTGTAGIAAIREGKPELVIVDLRIGDINGLEIIKLCRAEAPTASVIMVTGHGSVDTAVESTRERTFEAARPIYEPMHIRVKADGTTRILRHEKHFMVNINSLRDPLGFFMAL